MYQKRDNWLPVRHGASNACIACRPLHGRVDGAPPALPQLASVALLARSVAQTAAPCCEAQLAACPRVLLGLLQLPLLRLLLPLHDLHICSASGRVKRGNELPCSSLQAERSR